MSKNHQLMHGAMHAAKHLLESEAGRRVMADAATKAATAVGVVAVAATPFLLPVAVVTGTALLIAKLVED